MQVVDYADPEYKWHAQHSEKQFWEDNGKTNFLLPGQLKQIYMGTLTATDIYFTGG